MSIYDQMAQKIIEEQESIIGPLAWIEARKVAGITFADNQTGIAIQGESKEVLNRLVSQYEKIFGRASREVCKSAVASLILDLPPTDIPETLK